MTTIVRRKNADYSPVFNSFFNEFFANDRGQGNEQRNFVPIGLFCLYVISIKNNHDTNCHFDCFCIVFPKILFGTSFIYYISNQIKTSLIYIISKR